MGRSLNRRIAKQFADIDGWPPTGGDHLPPAAPVEAVIKAAVDAAGEERRPAEPQPTNQK